MVRSTTQSLKNQPFKCGILALCTMVEEILKIFIQIGKKITQGSRQVTRL